MDVISFSEAATANSRIEIINANPDSTSGIVTVPKVIASGENITIPAGRVAILPNVVIDGILNIENDGEVFIPSGSTFGDLDTQIALKADTSYVNAQLVLKQNVLVTNDAGVKTALNATGAAPIYACRAWVNFNGTGTVAIRESGNVSSITDNGVGIYTVNFTTAMPDANYSVAINANAYTGRVVLTSTLRQDAANSLANSMTSVRILTSYYTDFNGSNAGSDQADVSVSIFR